MIRIEAKTKMELNVLLFFHLNFYYILHVLGVCIAALHKIKMKSQAIHPNDDGMKMRR